MELPDLNKLSVAQKDELIHELFANLSEALKQISALTAKVDELEGRLALNSHNSSKPPSSDGLCKPAPKSLRIPGQRPTGGQKGHKGDTLEQVAKPDYTKEHYPPTACPACHATLSGQVMSLTEKRQVFDLPPTKYEVTEHRVFQTRCTCGQVCRGEFPAAVSASVQYGARAKAAVVHLTCHHMMPFQRTAALMGDFHSLPMSDGTVFNIVQEAGRLLKPTVDAIGEAIKNAPVVHADETGMRVGGKSQWLHALATPLLTWVDAHEKRGKEAFEALAILTVFMGTLIHDGWMSYRDLLCTHALCNAHHLRELVYLFEVQGQAWANKMFDLLVEACHEVTKAGGALPQPRITYYRDAYKTILAEGDLVNPRAPSSGKRGKTKQSKGYNLIDRLRIYEDDVWRFASDPNVPFTNNAAEQVMRMLKVKQKISGCFRTTQGISTFCTIRSYIATMHKQKQNVFESLVQTFQGAPPQPRFN